MKPEHFETVPGVSKTVPDDTMTIQQIVERFTRGQRLPENMMKSSIFDSKESFDNYDLEEVARMDIVEKHEIRQNLEKDISDKKTFLEEQKQKAAQADRLRSAQGKEESLKKSGESKASEPREGGTTPSKKRANSEQKQQDDSETDD